MCWAGVNRLGAIAARLGFADRAAHWNAAADTIQTELLEKAWNSKRNAFTAALDSDEQQAICAGLLLDDLVGQADRRSADLVRGHDLAAAHRSFLGLTGPPWRPHRAVAEGTMEG